MPLDIARIENLRPQNRIHYFSSIGSTMVEAAKLAAAGAPHGTTILADEQTAGLGRLGRSWISPADFGIYCSILLRLDRSSADFPIANLLLGLCTAEAIHKSTSLSCDLRWPNDVLVGDRKVAGILAHLVDTCIVAGIGINVNQTSFDPKLRTPATSLRIAAQGRLQSRETIVVNLLESVDSFCETLQLNGPGAILQAFASASSYVLNRRVTVDESGIQGVTAGLDANGFLLVRSDAGALERITTGGIRPLG